MYTLKTSDYHELLKQCYEHRQPLMVYGGPGIGKSAIPRQVFRKIAENKGKIYGEWSDLTLEQKQECIEKPEKYFIFADMRTSQMDTTSLAGIPNMARADMLENIPYSWVVYFTQTKAQGVIFFDEINLAAPIVQSITYSAIHDRVISDRRLADGVYVFAAGNRAEDRAHTFDMPLPLRDRFAEAEVKLDSDAWLNWAMDNKVNPHLINFIAWKPSHLYNVKEIKDDKCSTPRGVHRASTLIGESEIDSDQVHMLVSVACGEGFATQFQAYTKCYAELDWKKIFASPETVKNMSLDRMYAISGGLVERFTKNPKDMKLVGKIFEVLEYLREDFAVNTLRMIKAADIASLRDALQKLNLQRKVADKYGKFLFDAGN